MDKKQFKIKNNFNKSIMRQVYSILAIVLIGMSQYNQSMFAAPIIDLEKSYEKIRKRA